MGDFVQRFHALPGDIIREKQQNLFKLFQEHSFLKNSPEELDAITASLHADNYLERIFRTDFLIFFQRFDELYNDFKSGDQITIKKLSKHQWFYEKAFKEVSRDDFINSVLPSCSFSLKTTILKKIPLDDPHADDIFDGVSRKYGLHLATILLPKCSSDKIRDTLKKYPIKLTVTQLEAIFHKDPSLIEVYLEERTKLEGNSQFIDKNPILIYIAQKNPKLFSELFEKFNFDTTLGRRTTKKYIDSQGDKVLGDKLKYLKILNKGVTVRKVGNEVSELLFEPEVGCPTHWKAILQYYPKHRQFEVFKASYDKLHHEKFGENVGNITEDELRLIPDAGLREQLAQRKNEKKYQENFLKYYTPQVCLKEFMDKINYLGSAERAKYVGYTLESAFLNNDPEVLLKITEVVATRLKNDDIEIQRVYIRTLDANKKKLDLFDERHWKFVDDILAGFEVKIGYHSDDSKYLASRLLKLVKNGKPIKDVVAKITFLGSFMFQSKDKDVNRAVLVQLLDLGLQKNNGDDKELERAFFDCELVHFCKNYNKKYPGNTITIFPNPRIYKSVQYVLEHNNNEYVNLPCRYGVQHVIHQNASLRALYFSNFKTFERLSSLMWFLQNEPAALVQYFDEFLKAFSDSRINSAKFWKYIKKCSHLGLDTRTVEFFRQKLSEEGYKSKKRLARALSILTPVEAHLELVKRYKPLSDKVDLTDDEAKELYEIQGKLVRCLPLVEAPRQVLEATFYFCRGDYLQFALSPLYSSVHKLPENESVEFLEKLRNYKAVSVKKHAAALSCVILSEDKVKKCLQESTVSTLLVTMRYFSKNPSEELWSLVETKIQGLEKNELPLLKPALNIQIPSQYKSWCVETMWKLLDKHDDKETKKLLIPKIDKRAVRDFTTDFALKIIKENIFKFEDAHQVIANILIFSKTPQRFTLLSDILSDLKKTWNNSATRRDSRQKLASFIQTVFTTYMKEEETNSLFVKELTSVFTSVFSFRDAFDEVVAVRCMAWKKQTENCAKGLIGLNQEVCKEFGSYAIRVLLDCLNNFVLKHAWVQLNEKLKLCHAIIKYKEEDCDWLLILGLLPKTEPQLEETFVLYEEILRAATLVEDGVVQVQMGLFLKNSSHSNSVW